MKKLLVCLSMSFLWMMIIPTDLKADSVNSPYTIEAKQVSEKAQVGKLLARLDVIKETDKSEMSSAEKKSLRKEVRSIKEQLKNLNGGIYLSVGAIILIAILLIILL